VPGAPVCQRPAVFGGSRPRIKSQACESPCGGMIAEIQGLRPDRAVQHGTNRPDDEPKLVGFSVGPIYRPNGAQTAQRFLAMIASTDLMPICCSRKAARSSRQ
jgi:hypothetical protein